MRRLMKAGIILVIILALIVSVQAGSVTSRGSGISSHDAGGSGYATMSTAAGNSAHVVREVCRELNQEASPPDVTVTWGDTATDDVGSVTAAGTLKVSREISGGDDGWVKVCARIWADLDESDDPIFDESSVWVDTGMESTVDVEAGDGVTAEGSASVTGFATGSGNWAFDGVSGDVAATSSGKVSVSGMAKDGAKGQAMSIIYAGAETFADGYSNFMGTKSADTSANCFTGVLGGILTQAEGSGEKLEMSADASGSAVMSARGTSDDYSFTTAGSAIGSSSGEFEIDPDDGGGSGAFMSGLGVYYDYFVPGIEPYSVVDEVYPMLGAGGMLETWSDESEGSVEASARGIAILRESAYNGMDGYGYDAFGSVQGSAEIEAEQSGNGISAEKAFMEAAPIEPACGWVYHELWYPYKVSPDGIRDKKAKIVFDEFADATSYIEAESWMESGCGEVDGSSSSSIQGTAYTTFGGYGSMNSELSDGSQSYSGSMTTRASGQVSQELAVDGYGYAEGLSIIDSIASLGPEIEDGDGSGWVYLGKPCRRPEICLHWSTFSGAGDMLYTADYAEAEGTASSESAVSGMATSGATGSLNYGSIINGENAALLAAVEYDFASTASVSGKVNGKVKATDAEAETASAILGFNAVGLDMCGRRCCDRFTTGPFVVSKDVLFSNSAVVDYGIKTGSAEGTASGSSSAGGTLTIVEFAPEDDFTAQQVDEKYDLISATRGSGTLTSKMSVKNEGVGISETMLEGGNVVTALGDGTGYGGGYITSLGIYDWDNSIDTSVCGMGLSDGSQVKGTAAITKGVSTESAHYGYSLWDDDDEEWDLMYALDTKTVMADPSKSEIKIKGFDGAKAETWAYGGSEAYGDMSGAYLESWAGFGADVCRSDEGDTAKASTTKLNIYTEAKADGLSTYARVNKGYATAKLSSSSSSIGPGCKPVMVGGTGPTVMTDSYADTSCPDLFNQYAYAYGWADVMTPP